MPSRSVQRYLPPLNERSRRWLRFLGVLAGAWLLVSIITGLSTVLTPVVIALALAYILNPVVTWMEEKRGISRLVSVSTGLFFLGCFVLVGLLIGGVQVAALAADLSNQSRWEAFLERISSTFNYVRTFGGGEVATSQPSVASLAQTYGVQAASAASVFVTGLFSSATYWATALILIPLYTFFFTLEFNHMVTTVRDHLPLEYRPTIVRIVSTIDRSIAAFFRGRVVVCTIIGFLSGLGWLIVGVKHSLLLGAAAGILNLVPFLSIAVVPAAVIIAYLDNTAAWAGPVTLAAGVYFVVQAIESFILTPVIESKSSGLHPVTTVIALLIGAQVAGLLGMLLAIPIASTLKSLGSEYVMPEIRRLAGQATPDEEAAPEAAESVPAGDSDAEG